jgi:hypothetical protein
LPRQGCITVAACNAINTVSAPPFLEEIEAVKQRLPSLETERYSLSPEEEIRIRSIGDHFAGVWQSNHCPPTLKKMIFRTAAEEIIVRTDQDKKNLSW